MELFLISEALVTIIERAVLGALGGLILICFVLWLVIGRKKVKGGDC